MSYGPQFPSFTPGPRKNASTGYLSTLSRILQGQAPGDFGGVEGEDEQAAAAGMPPQAVAGPQLPPPGMTSVAGDGDRNVAAPPPAGPPAPAPSPPASAVTQQQLLALLSHPFTPQTAAFNPANLGPLPSHQATGDQKKRALLGSLLSALVGGALGGNARGALSSGVGFLGGAEQAREGNYQDQVNAYNQSAQNEQARVQGVNTQQAAEGRSYDTNVDNLRQTLGIQLTDENRDATRAALEEQKAATLAANIAKTKEDAEAKQRAAFQSATQMLASLSGPGRKALSPVIAAQFPEIADKVPGLVDSLNAAEKEASVQAAAKQKQAKEAERVKGLDKELADILKSGNNKQIDRANQILDYIHPGAMHYDDISKSMTPYQQAQIGVQQGQLGVAQGRLAVDQKKAQEGGTGKSDLPERRFAYEQSRDAARDVTSLTKLRDAARADEQRLNTLLQMPKGKMVQTSKGSGKTVPVPESTRDAIRKQRDAAYARANDLDGQIEQRQAGGYIPPGGVAPATVIGPDGRPFTKPPLPQSPSPVAVPGKGYMSAKPHPKYPDRNQDGKYNGNTPGMSDAEYNAMKKRFKGH